MSHKLSVSDLDPRVRPMLRVLISFFTSCTIVINFGIISKYCTHENWQFILIWMTSMGSVGSAIYPLNLSINVAFLFIPIFLLQKKTRPNIYYILVIGIVFFVSCLAIFAKVFPAPVFASKELLFKESSDSKISMDLIWLPFKMAEPSTCED